MSQKIFSIIENASNFIGIFTFLGTVIIWFKLRKQNKIISESWKSIPKMESFEEMRKYHEEINTFNPVALCMSLVPNSASIKNDVNNFLTSKGGKFKKMPILEFNINSGISVDNIEDFINRIRYKRAEIEAMNYTEVHLFIQGPVQAATIIGAIFDNWKVVKLYHKNNDTKNYEYWSHLIK
jgi:hypothetical protein